MMKKTFEIKDEDNLPKELTEAREAGKTLQVHTAVGWLDIEVPELLCGNTYRINHD